MSGLVRIPTDLAGLDPFERPGFEGVMVLGMSLGAEPYEVTCRKLPVPASHTMPAEDGRAPERQEVADLVVRLFIALTSCAGGARPNGEGRSSLCGAPAGARNSDNT